MAAHMAARIRPTPVKSGILDACRDWREWLEPLDDIKSKRGLEGLMASDCHWLCFCRRRDLHPNCAAVSPAPGSDSSPGEVVLQAKRYMSDNALMQPPFVMLRAGASVHLQPPTGPGAWQQRHELTDADAIHRLCRKILDTLPSRSAAVEYLRNWMARPRLPEEPPTSAAVLSHRFGDAAAGGAAWQVFAEALRPDPADDEPQVALVVKRRRGNEGQRHVAVPLPVYVDFRTSQGISVQEAVKEWNGGAIVGVS